jgi:gamma-glutamyltranspeptidase/glutathione hydrolase
MRTRSYASFSIAGVLVAAGWVLTGDAQSPTPFGIPNAGAPAPTAGIAAVAGSRAQGWLAQGRSEVLARHGMVATSDPLASQAGLEVLRQGGNAIDAAVATGAVLDVTSQNDTGIGGDLFAIVWVAKEQKLYALNAAGRAPAGWTPEFFTQKLGQKRVPGNGVNAATVPGAVAGYDALLKRFGTMTFKQTFERAARIAEEGWGQAERRHDDIRGALAGLRADADSKQVFLNGEDAHALYSIIRNPNLAKALRLIQAEGKDAFYKGAIAEAIVQKVQSGGGVMTRDDLAKYEAEWVEPVTTNYHGYDIYQLPPPGQGFAALEMLNILEVCVPKLGYNLAQLGPSNPMYWHLMVEAKKLAYADLQAKNGDPKFGTIPVQQLLSKSHAATLCGRIDPTQARKPAVPGSTDGGTIYLTTADRWGNMVSLVHSVFGVYGSRATVGPYGFVLHNRGSAFSLEPGPNQVAPGKQPFHTIIAGFVMKDGQPLMAFGNMGGSVQPETHAQHMVNLIDHGMNVQMTTDAARFTHNQNSNVLSLEANLFTLVGHALASKGHEVRSVDGGSVGGYQGILFTRDPRLTAPTFDRRSIDDDLPVNGVYRGGSDHRKDGQAVGW